MRSAEETPAAPDAASAHGRHRGWGRLQHGRTADGATETLTRRIGLKTGKFTKGLIFGLPSVHLISRTKYLT